MCSEVRGEAPRIAGEAPALPGQNEHQVARFMGVEARVPSPGWQVFQKTGCNCLHLTVLRLKSPAAIHAL
jgi:hypothetical protein